MSSLNCLLFKGFSVEVELIRLLKSEIENVIHNNLQPIQDPCERHRTREPGFQFGVAQGGKNAGTALLSKT